jgi:YebC/PmpR family DNA-binding regulatory protein
MGRAFERRKASKEKRWANMSRIFPKLSRAITVAAKEGGGDADLNPRLRSAIMNAKAQNLPKEIIDNAIKKALGKDGANLQEVSFEGKGPHGVLLFIECTTDNNTRTVANIKSYFNKLNGQLLTNGSLEFMFERKAVFEFEKPQNMDLEEIELELIDYGLEEMEDDGEYVYVYGSFGDFKKLHDGFENLKIELKRTTIQRIPTDPKDFSDEELEDIDKLINRLEDDEDVQEVYTNIQ